MIFCHNAFYDMEQGEECRYMKAAIMGFCMTLMIVLTCTTVFTIENNTSRKNELEANLSSAVISVMQNISDTKSESNEATYSIASDTDAIQDTIQSMLVAANSNGAYDVKINSVDIAKGLLSVNVDETYTMPNGKEITISASKTAILEPVSYSVSFYKSDGTLIAAKDAASGSVLLSTVCDLPSGCGGWEVFSAGIDMFDAGGNINKDNSNGFVTSLSQVQVQSNLNLVAVPSIKLTALSIDKGSAEVNQDGQIMIDTNGTLQLSYVMTPSNATTEYDVVWRSSDPNIASVDSTGLVTAKNATGDVVTITVTVGDVSNSVKLYVRG